MTQAAEVFENTPIPIEPVGLAVFDLAVSATPLEITWNQNALDAALDAVLDAYRDVEVKEDDVPEIKSEMAALNKLRDKLDSARKDITGQIKAPIDAFDSAVKKMIARVVETRSGLDTQVKAFETRDRESRRVAVQLMIEVSLHEAECQDLVIPVNDSWLNKSAKTAITQAEIGNIISEHQKKKALEAQLERGKQDRLTLVEAMVKAEGERRGFTLSMGKFRHCLSLAMESEEIQSYISAVYTAEAEIRERAAQPTSVQTHQTVQPALPVPVLMPTAPAAPVSSDQFEMPVADATAPFPTCDVMTLTLTYDPAREPDILTIVDQLRDFATVIIS